MCQTSKKLCPFLFSNGRECEDKSCKGDSCAWWSAGHGCIVQSIAYLMWIEGGSK